MAAFSYDEYRAPDEPGTLTALLNWGGAILSLVLIAGLATWGWKLWVRDVSGVPVVRALEGPMRVAPADPGGRASEYQGLTVNRIAEDRVGETVTDTVVLAPAPTTLDEAEDLAMADLPAVAPEVIDENVLRSPVPETGSVLIPPRPEIGTPERITLEDAGERTLAARIDESGTESGTLSAPAPEENPSATDVAVAAALADAGLRPEPTANKVEAAAHVPVITPRPRLRPENLQAVALRPAEVETTSGVAVSAAAPKEVDIASVPVGTRLAQLGAYATPEIARQEWDVMSAAFGASLEGKTRIIQRVESSGREFFRLRVMGFENLAQARRFCAVLVAENANCIPVIHE